MAHFDSFFEAASRTETDWVLVYERLESKPVPRITAITLPQQVRKDYPAATVIFYKFGADDVTYELLLPDGVPASRELAALVEELPSNLQ